ncbi:hypothetical protein X975_16948, partial [Stegodyphus mimosarum]
MHSTLSDSLMAAYAISAVFRSLDEIDIPAKQAHKASSLIYLQSLTASSHLCDETYP